MKILIILGIVRKKVVHPLVSIPGFFHRLTVNITVCTTIVQGLLLGIIVCVGIVHLQGSSQFSFIQVLLVPVVVNNAPYYIIIVVVVGVVIVRGNGAVINLAIKVLGNSLIEKLARICSVVNPWLCLFR
jgi:hypothetical protein